MRKSNEKLKKLMKSFLLIIAIVFSGNIMAQPWWYSQTSGTTNALNSVYFTDSNIGYTVGFNGTILKTSNGGNTWSVQTSGTTNSLSSVCFTDANTGYVSGGVGTILKTINGGTTWTSIGGGTTNYSGIDFTSTTTGYIVGTTGTIRKTTNSGTAWTTQTSGTTNWLRAVYFVDANTGFSVGDAGTILKTTNGGSTWTTQTSGTTNALYSVYFTSTLVGYAVGATGKILKTTNGGSTWTAQTSGTTQNLRAVNFTDANTGNAVGDGGTILSTTNGGTSWTAQTSGTTSQLYSIYTIDVNTIFAVGNVGTILNTTIWQTMPSGTTNAFYGVFFNDANTGDIAAANGRAFRTSDGGLTFPGSIPGANNFRSVNFTSATTGYMSGDGGMIYKTTNSGVTWSALTSGTTNALNSICFASTTTGYTAGVGGTILKTINSGSTWTAQTSGTGQTLNSIYFTSTTTGYAVGTNGTIIKTTNSGSTWTALTSGTTNALNSVYFTDASTGYAVGVAGKILKTTNSGTTWTAVTSGTTNPLNSVYFPEANFGYAVGALGTILKTTDAGTSWAVQASGTTNSLYSVHFPVSSTGYAVGASGTVLKLDCAVPSTPGTITGNATICSGSSNTYSVTAVSGATSYTWTLPSGWTGTSTTNSITTTASTTSGNITVMANNDCGSSAVTTKAITVNSIPATPGTISGNTTTCSSTSNTYSITAVSGATSYTWTLPTGWTGTSTTTSITATSTASSGNVTVKANNTCGSSAVKTLAVTVTPSPNTPGAISGNTTVCEGTSQTYTIATVSGATSYTWTLPGGWTGTSTTTSISSTSGTTSGNITVKANGTCGSSGTRSIAVTVNPLPATPGTITGNSTVCSGSSNTYSFTAVSGATSYTWTLPSGWTGTSTTNSITTTASTTSGNITVTADNSCGSSSVQTLAVTVNPIPVTPGTISGNVSICSGSVNTYSISAVSGATSYTWTLPSGWTGTSTSTSITTTASSTGGDITVTADNSCGSSSAQTLTVSINSIPTTPGTITGNSTVCSGSSNTYSISAVSGATSYTWTLPSGWSGSSASTSITTTSSTTSGNVTVSADNSCGSSSIQTLAVTVNSAPSTPGAISGNTPICSGTTNTYSIVAVSGASSYTWTLPIGWAGTSTSTSITTTASTTSGNITVTANNSCGNSSAQTLSVAINNATSITQQPVGDTICINSDYILSVNATGSNLTYQWYRNAVIISGANSSTYTVNEATPAYPSSYYCNVAGDCGSVNSDYANMYIGYSLTYNNMANKTVCPNGTATFFADVFSAVSKQWKKDGVPLTDGGNISGATTSTLTITNCSASDEATYSCYVTGNCSTDEKSATLTLLTPVSINSQPVDNQICEGSNYTFTVGATGSGLTYQWKKDNVNITGATSASYDINNSQASNSGTYTCVITGTCSAETSYDAVLTVNPIYASTISDAICEGNTYTLGTQSLTTTGIYTETLTTIAGCDSIITLNLTVNPVYAVSDVATICNGENYILGTQTLTVTGTYTEVFSAINGCDSIVTIDLTVNPVYAASDVATICDGDSYTFGTQALTSTGTYVETFSSVNGCDSVVTLDISVNPVFASNDVVTICDGSSYIFGTQTLTSTGTYYETFASELGCDSVVNLTLTVNPTFAITDAASICEGDSYAFGSQTLIIAGDYTETFSSVSGCDSVVTLTLIVNPVFATSDVAAICDGDSYILGTQTLTTPGTYSETFTSIAGCDSVVMLNLTVNPSYSSTINAEICEGELYTLPDATIVTISGTYTSTFATTLGCDSIITTELTVHPVYNITEDVQICSGNSYELPDGTFVNTDGTYTSNLSSSSGCDSIIVTNLTVTSQIINNVFVSICDGDSFFAEGNWHTTTGVYYDTTTASFGCDSIIVTNLTVNTVFATSNVATICDGDSYVFGTQTLTIAGDYTETFASELGCDSVVTLTLSVNPVYATTDVATICQSDSYVFGTQTLTTAGDFTETFASELGCDSVVTLTLSVNPLIIVDLGSDDTLCFNNAEVLTLDAGNTGMTYLWSDASSNQIFIADAIALGMGIHTISVTVTDGVCTSTDEIVLLVDICSDIVAVKDQLNISMYPNPTKDMLNIAIEGLNSEAVLNIMDFSGRIILNETLTAETTMKKVDFSNLPKGIYAVKVSTGDVVKVSRIVVQ